MRISIHCFAALAARELINGHARLPSLDIPQGLIDTAEGVIQHRAILPIGTVVARLPDVLDTVRAFT
jgi:hypothetical protein